MGEGRIMHDYMDIGGRAKQDARAEGQLTTLNSVTSRHAESCISRLFGYIPARLTSITSSFCGLTKSNT